MAALGKRDLKRLTYLTELFEHLSEEKKIRALFVSDLNHYMCSGNRNTNNYSPLPEELK